ncbi:hypothetical protein [Streptomyces sp. NPDC059781]|uniref:hypothetical protein n=1 Tax=Streptomyces sp. NPDC059781 TaxID=3346943 RepID=UPI0036547F00
MSGGRLAAPVCHLGTPPGPLTIDMVEQAAVVPYRDRDLDHSWSQIGQSLGISKQAAWERYGKSRPEQASR